jgi:hypothetical protein
MSRYRPRCRRAYRRSERRRQTARAVLGAFGADGTNRGLGAIYEIVESKIQKAYQTVGSALALAYYLQDRKPKILTSADQLTEEDFDAVQVR